MNWFASVNLIHLFDFYLAAMFVVGTYRRVAQYRAFAGLALGMPGRWPRLFQLVRQFRTIFLMALRLFNFPSNTVLASAESSASLANRSETS